MLARFLIITFLCKKLNSEYLSDNEHVLQTIIHYFLYLVTKIM